MGFKPRKQTNFKVGDLVAMKCEAGDWVREPGGARDAIKEETSEGVTRFYQHAATWRPWPQEPAFCIVEEISTNPPHTDNRKLCVKVSSKDISGAAGETPWRWVDPAKLRLVMPAVDVAALVRQLPDELK